MELKCKHCSGGKVGDVKTTECGNRQYPRMLPDRGILYKLGPYVVNGSVTVNVSQVDPKLTRATPYRQKNRDLHPPL